MAASRDSELASDRPRRAATPAATDGRTRRVVHETRYVFAAPVAGLEVAARLAPRERPWQRTLASRVTTVPPPAGRASALDAFGNRVEQLTFPAPLGRLEIVGTSLVRLTDGAEDAEEIDPGPFRGPAAAAADRGGTVWRWAAQDMADLDPAPAEIAAFLDRCRREMVHDPALVDREPPVEAVLATGRGVCRDFARLAITCLRARGVPARYVIGYVDHPDVPGGLAHAWLSWWSGATGWRDADPTTGLDPRRHVTLAWGRDHDDVQPVAGRIAGGGKVDQRLAVAVTVVAE